MDLTVIICTRDRAASLSRTLSSLAAAEPPGSRWELLVVDNGSRDATAEVIAGFADRLPIRRVWQPTPGLSNARNAGVGASSGRHILWTDDDVVVHREWLSAYMSAFSAHPAAALFGGPTRPVFEEPVQTWFRDEALRLESLLAIRDFGAAEAALTPDRIPYGLNYAVRGDVQRRLPYDASLGVAPGRRTGGEEVEVMKVIFSEGGSGVWVPTAWVDHMIPAARQTEAYIISYYSAEAELKPQPLRAWESTRWTSSIGGGLRWLRYKAARKLGLKGWMGALLQYARFQGSRAVHLRSVR